MTPRLRIAASVALVVAGLLGAAAPSAHAAICDVSPRKDVHFDATAAAAVVASINYQRVQAGLSALQVSPGIGRYLRSAYLRGNPYEPAGADDTAQAEATTELLRDCGFTGDWSFDRVYSGQGRGSDLVSGDALTDPDVNVIAVIIDYSRSDDSYWGELMVGSDASVGAAPPAGPPPSAVAEHLTVAYCGSGSVTVTANDDHVGAQPLFVMSAGDARTRGGVDASPFGRITYIAPDHVSGKEVVPYTIADIYGRSSTGSLSVTVLPNRHHLKIRVAPKISLWALNQFRLGHNLNWPNSDASVYFSPRDDDLLVSFEMYRESEGHWVPTTIRMKARGGFGLRNYVWLGKRLLGFSVGRYQVRAQSGGESSTAEFSLVS